MANDKQANSVMTLVPAGSDIVHSLNSVTIFFPSEDDAIIFCEVIKKLSGDKELNDD